MDGQTGELKMVDDGRTDDGPWLYYKLTNEPKGSGELIMHLYPFQLRFFLQSLA